MVARELISETALRDWVCQAEVDAMRDAPGSLTTDERTQLSALRRATLPMKRAQKTDRARRCRAIAGTDLALPDIGGLP